MRLTKLHKKNYTEYNDEYQLVLHEKIKSDMESLQKEIVTRIDVVVMAKKYVSLKN